MTRVLGVDLRDRGPGITVYVSPMWDGSFPRRRWYGVWISVVVVRPFVPRHMSPLHV